MSTLGYVHHSGRYDRTPEQLAGSLLAQARIPGVGAIGVTEVAARGRARGARLALQGFGWNLAHVPGGECALAYDTWRYGRVRVTERTVSTVKTWSKTGRLRAPFTVLFVQLVDLETRETILVSVGHTPSHVDAGKGWRKNNRSRQHRDGLRGWRQQQTQLRHEWHPTGGHIVSMDLNLDVRHAWVRVYLRRCFPGMRLVTDAKPVGTHGHRAIDVVLVSRQWSPRAWFKGKRVRVVRAVDSDHRSIVVRLARKAVGKR